MFGFGKKKKKKLEEKNAREVLSETAKKIETEEVIPQEEKTPAEDQSVEGKNNIDKLVMGAIVGVAIGSVLGFSLWPKKKAKKDKSGKPLKKIPHEID